MVSKAAILAANEGFARQSHSGCVAVFAGATNGIGEYTLSRMVTLLEGSTLYVLGRSFANISQRVRENAAARNNKIVFVEAQVSRIADVDSACDMIIEKESKVDYLCMSQGGFPWGGASYTDEGLEVCFSLSYYSRLRIVSKLLPLLRRASRPCVLSILSGSKENTVDEDDLGLDKSWAILPAMNHTTTFNSLAFDYLSKHDDEKKIIFLHGFPGLVKTDKRKLTPSKQSGIFWWAVTSVMQALSDVVVYFTGMNVEESGERHAYVLTSDSFQAGSWQINQYSDVVPPNDVLRKYREQGLAEKLWDHTQRVWEKALASHRPSRTWHS
ncbi:hypothetical protein GGR52DRAFT_248193 [Hypoxylon sp. FL1284]|nr:hypothetical protein GGR52DRAFT_248193 [Hypoxylon sp. FL1284]